MITGKKIVFISPAFFGIEKIVVDKLRKNNNIVYYFDERPFRSAIKKAINTIFPKAFLRSSDKYYKNEFSKCSFSPDIILIVKGEQVSKKTIELIREMYPKARLMLYLWDAVTCVKGIADKIPLYDKVLSFDRLDCIKYNLVFRPLFCDNESLQTIGQNQEYDLCFYGTMHTDRFSVLTRVNNIANELGLKVAEHCYLPSRFMCFYYWITNKGYRKFNKGLLSFKSKSQAEISAMIENSRVILDINDRKQSGLTIRTLESLFARRKIITTNKDIINYDFYDEEDVLIIDRDNVEMPASFFEKNNLRRDLDNKIRHKYSAEGWIEDVFQ